MINNNSFNDYKKSDVDLHIEYEARKRSLIKENPNLTPEQYQRKLREIAKIVGI